MKCKWHMSENNKGMSTDMHYNRCVCVCVLFISIREISDLKKNVGYVYSILLGYLTFHIHILSKRKTPGHLGSLINLN